MWRNHIGFKPIYTAGFSIPPFALLAEQMNVQRHKSELPNGWRYFIRSPVSQVYRISGIKKAQSLDRALKLVNIWVAALKFKPLRIKLSRHWVPWYCFHGTFLKALKKPTFLWAYLYGNRWLVRNFDHLTQICHYAVDKSITRLKSCEV